MDVLLFGHGYMGSLIYRFLEKNELVDNIYVIDPNPRKEVANGKVYPSFESLPQDVKADACFIASNSVTHIDVLKKVAKAGIKNIFVEKPMCLSKQEYLELNALLPKDSKVVVDYILRASPAVMAFQQKAEELKEKGFKLKQTNVVYGKDKSQDPRRFRDIGVYEELYHVWDMCFNDMMINKIQNIKTVKNIYYPDPEIDKRCLAQRFKYLIETADGEKSFLTIYSDFKMPMRHRGFVQFFYKGKEKETLSLIFDQGGMDKVIYVDSNNQEQVLDFAANQKLSKKIDDTIAYFNGSRPAPYFHDGMTSFKFHILLEQMGQTAPMAKSALMERILSTNTQHTR